MSYYIASAGSFVFFIVIGFLGGNLLHLEGPQWYFFVGLLSALGLSAAGLFYYFQTKMQERKEGSGGDGSARIVSGAAMARTKPIR